MRIIAGERRGLKLYTLDGVTTRPTLDRVKETMFNVINFDIQDKVCLDVFAGSGNLSMEAISRGAKCSHLIELDKNAFDIINKNIEKANFEDRAIKYNSDFREAFKKIKNNNIKFSIVFLDPPYNEGFYDETLDLLLEYNLLEDDAIIAVEHEKQNKLDFSKYSIWKEKSFSKNAVTFLRLIEN